MPLRAYLYIVLVYVRLYVVGAAYFFLPSPPPFSPQSLPSISRASQPLTVARGIERFFSFYTHPGR